MYPTTRKPRPWGILPLIVGGVLVVLGVLLSGDRPFVPFLAISAIGSITMATGLAWLLNWYTHQLAAYRTELSRYHAASQEVLRLLESFGIAIGEQREYHNPDPENKDYLLVMKRMGDTAFTAILRTLWHQGQEATKVGYECYFVTGERKSILLLAKRKEIALDETAPRFPQDIEEFLTDGKAGEPASHAQLVRFHTQLREYLPNPKRTAH